MQNRIAGLQEAGDMRAADDVYQLLSAPRHDCLPSQELDAAAVVSTGIDLNPRKLFL